MIVQLKIMRPIAAQLLCCPSTGTNLIACYKPIPDTCRRSVEAFLGPKQSEHEHGKRKFC
jgi:hypothetical protein